jgi:hypothetical protein
MKPLLIILGSLYLLTQPTEALGKVYQHVDEQGAPAYAVVWVEIFLARSGLF